MYAGSKVRPVGVFSSEFFFGVEAGSPAFVTLFTSFVQKIVDYCVLIAKLLHISRHEYVY
jgi:hypothetical protein